MILSKFYHKFLIFWPIGVGSLAIGLIFTYPFLDWKSATLGVLVGALLGQVLSAVGSVAMEANSERLVKHLNTRLEGKDVR